MMGSKGDNTMIWILIAVIVGILVLYFLWSRGLIPIFGESSRAQCEGKMITACDRGDEAEIRRIWDTCRNAFKGDEKLQDETNIDTVCQILLARSRGQQEQT
ncbi:MAG: hypothetical protein QXL86_00825 [Candidatus Aenigmatarchaeota archaeon]